MTERVSANGRAAFPFPGGDVDVPKPTRAELALSAMQWSTSLREHIQDNGMHDSAACRRIDRLDAVLTELEALCRE